LAVLANPQWLGAEMRLDGRKPIALAKVSQSGVFDPSVAKTPRGERVWMSYSAVDPSPRWPEKTTRAVTTRLAHSDDGGATWTDLGHRINDISERGDAPRTWQNEVSSLVFDPHGRPDERWKLFWHHYAAVGEKRQFENGWIAYKSAARPEGLRVASEIKLFGAKGYADANDIEGGSTASPLGGRPAIMSGQLGRDLNCVALSEPGAIADAAGLYLAIGCFEVRLIPPRVEGKIVLLKCAVPCRPTEAGAWQFINTLISDKTAKLFGVEKFSGAELFSHAGRIYLIVSPVTNRPVSGAYNGCYIFRFADLDAGTLEQDGTGPRLVKDIRGADGTFNGACTYADALSASGFLYGEIRIAKPPVIQIFQTGKGM
jgi:hypothetical protein